MPINMMTEHFNLTADVDDALANYAAASEAVLRLKAEAEDFQHRLYTCERQRMLWDGGSNWGHPEKIERYAKIIAQLTAQFNHVYEQLIPVRERRDAAAKALKLAEGALHRYRSENSL